MHIRALGSASARSFQVYCQSVSLDLINKQGRLLYRTRLGPNQVHEAECLTSDPCQVTDLPRRIMFFHADKRSKDKAVAVDDEALCVTPVHPSSCQVVELAILHKRIENK